MPGCEKPSRWQLEDLAGAEEMLRDNGVYSEASETKLTAEFPRELGAATGHMLVGNRL